ncbi:hypothetical protein DFH09DRAFT_1274284 [Mycena vulgaris]|nr:hypothetical protein DFH09DRAFT_1274284 [Mycena vulgaris]
MIFNGVKYHLPSTLPDERELELTRLLIQHKATRADSIFDATHIITNSEAFEGWRDVGAEVKIVSDLWVERSIAAGKMQQTSFYSASRSKIFSGVVACSADLRVSDEEVLSVGITSLGGQWRMGLTKDVTHLFAVSTTSEKYCTGMSHRDQTHLKVLVPDWFDNSVVLGLPDLSTETFEWPDPEVLKRRPATPTDLLQVKKLQRNSLSPQKKALYKTASWDPSKPMLATKDVWGGRRILLSTTLELTGSRRKIVEDGIRQARGVPVAYTSNAGDGTSAEELRLLDICDVFVTRYRTGATFFKAWREGKTIGTLSWLLNVQVTGVCSSPLDQILHFPIPHGAVEGFDKHEISVTNYTGESRDYLKKLITLMGGNFTPSLSNKNTVLVAAQLNGPKTAKAAEWSISVVNHTWLEDCFLRWQSLTPAVSKYVSYPVGIDFASILGERGVGPDIEEIVAAEAVKEGFSAEDEEGGFHSQNSADETEVVGGLMPTVDMDVDMNGGGEDNLSEDVDFDMGNHKLNSPSISFEDDPGSTLKTYKSVGSSPAKPNSTPASPAKPKSVRKKHIRGLSTSSESQFDPEITKKVVRITRPTRASKSPSKKKTKSRDPESEAEASQDDEEEEPVKRAVVAAHARPLPKRKARDTESEAEASQDDSDSEPVARPVRKPLVRRVSGPAPHRSPRKTSDSEATTSKLPDLPDLRDSDSDMDDLPVQVALPPKPSKGKAPVVGGVIKVTRIPPSEPPKRQAGAKTKVPPRKATPTPPSSPLSALSSPKVVRRMPTATVEVVMPDVKTLSASARKPPPARTGSISAISHQRHTPVSAPPRSRLATTSGRASSPPSSSAVPENGVRAKRSAATKATQRLHDEIMPDVVNYQNEMRNRGRKGRRVSGQRETEGEEEEEEEEERPSTKRRKVDGAKKGRASTGDDESVVAQPVKAKSRKSEVALRNGKPIKLMSTGVDLSDGVLKALASLGAKTTSKPTECTHLVVSSLRRTEKFLCALAGAPFILTEQWAVDSVAENSLMPEEDYLLEDDAAEHKYNFSLSDAVDRARELKGKLFKDYVFYVTPNVKPEPSLLRNVVLANGGQIITNQHPSLRSLETHPNRCVISCAEDKDMWRPLVPIHTIYAPELVLLSALRQEMDWDDVKAKLK